MIVPQQPEQEMTIDRVTIGKIFFILFVMSFFTSLVFANQPN